MSEPKVYRIPVIWEMTGEVSVGAANLQAAIESAANHLYYGELAGHPIDDSLTVDLEGVAIRYPDEKHGQEADLREPSTANQEFQPDDRVVWLDDYPWYVKCHNSNGDITIWKGAAIVTVSPDRLVLSSQLDGSKERA